MSKNILLICHSFPPYPGIGGRRWAKFAKYMVRKGYTIHVIASENTFSEKKSNWMHDVADNPSIKVYQQPAMYPKTLLKCPNNIFEKILYRLSLGYVKWKIKGDYFDKGGLWRKQLRTRATELIKQFNITNVIVTGAPYHLCYFSCDLKNRFPEINFIVDLRDPWTTHNDEWSFGKLNPTRKAQEMLMEKEVIRCADHVISVYEVMTEHYSKTFPEHLHKFMTLPNGYDTNDFQIAASEKVLPSKEDKITFVFAGTLYDNLEYLLYPFFDALAKIKKMNPGVYQKLLFDFYGYYKEEYEKYSENLHLDIVKFHGEIPLTDSCEKIRNADFCILFLIKNYSFSLSTKFYEYVAQNKKVVVVSEKGFVTDLIEKHYVGYTVFLESIYDNLLHIISEYKKESYFHPSDLDVSRFDVKNLTEKIIHLLQ